MLQILFRKRNTIFHKGKKKTETQFLSSSGRVDTAI